MNRLENKVAIITGAAMGQGAAEAYLFAKEGAKVVATDMCEDILRETVQKINEDFSHSTIALKLNVTDEEEWKKVVEECINQFGTVDILLNNAGIGSKGINYDKTDYQASFKIFTSNVYISNSKVSLYRCPPSIVISVPVVYFDSSLAKYKAQYAISSASPICPKAVFSMHEFKTLG